MTLHWRMCECTKSCHRSSYVFGGVLKLLALCRYVLGLELALAYKYHRCYRSCFLPLTFYIFRKFLKLVTSKSMAFWRSKHPISTCGLEAPKNTLHWSVSFCQSKCNITSLSKNQENSYMSRGLGT
ncbi:predicted protein [Pyrenophora tritici-repentis Pt-1C-BFP]|uniref:Uncharacterized protein n=1 Tax=Pyrenophora tritici-repentis (strain Pt-1C-BFP) TaxID=426418 RepID=B2WEM1_PYRTR|nr:uncharacterized protein PTRG_08594 [Pyrenophora tritici-repentis Pt-1C-BFP]EDU51513.1 predicted protein [Pyrenophora tritici-repentis Pt-1C-BFP]